MISKADFEKVTKQLRETLCKICDHAHDRCVKLMIARAKVSWLVVLLLCLVVGLLCLIFGLLFLGVWRNFDFWHGCWWDCGPSFLCVCTLHPIFCISKLIEAWAKCQTQRWSRYLMIPFGTFGHIHYTKVLSRNFLNKSCLHEYYRINLPLNVYEYQSLIDFQMILFVQFGVSYFGIQCLCGTKPLPKPTWCQEGHELTHWHLVTPYCIIELGQHWFR